MSAFSNHRLFRQVVLGILGLIYFLGWIFLLTQYTEFHYFEGAAMSSLFLLFLLVLQWLSIAGNHADNDPTPSQLHIFQMIFAAAAFGINAYMWNYLMALFAGQFVEVEDKYLTAMGLFGFILGGAIMYFTGGKMHRYQAAQLISLSILTHALAIAGLCTILHAQTQGYEFIHDTMPFRIEEVELVVAQAWGVYVSVWALPALAYLVVFAKSHKASRAAMTREDGDA